MTILKNNSSIAILNLGYGRIDDGSVVKVCNIINSNTSLTSLKLKYNKITE